MSKSDVAVSVRGLSKAYTIAHEAQRHATLAEQMLSRLKHPFRHAETETFWALKDIDFHIKKGEVVGIIGRNGAGKSTLLKILSRITEPTAGEIRLYGRVGSLLEVGTGFHPELTGRENIFLNGAILGMTKAEIRKQFDAIIDFAEVEKFLETPVKRYSSGMYVRLAFAVAAHLNPEILVVDEVLAVGDGEFQKKCMGKMSDVAGCGSTVVVVSHQLNVINSLCTRAILLAKGKLSDDGTPGSVTARYMARFGGSSEWRCDERNNQVRNQYFVPTRFAVVNSDCHLVEGTLTASDRIGVIVEGELLNEHPALTIGFAIYACSGELLFWSLATDRPKRDWPKFSRGPNRIVGWIPAHWLNEGDYRVELIVSLHFAEWLSQPGINAPSVSLSIRGGLSESPFWILPRPGLNAPILEYCSI